MSETPQVSTRPRGPSLFTMVASLTLLLVLTAACQSPATPEVAHTVAFDTPLAIPPIESGTLDGAGNRVFELRAEKGSREFLPGETTPTWGYNGSYLGPTLRANRGDHVKVKVTNELDEATTVHWHGMHLPARADGGPHQLVQPGHDWEPEWTINQPAATLWYHPHPHGQTGRHVYNGLAGLFIIDDGQAAMLPHDYGVDDVPLIVQDKRLDADGKMRLDDDSLVGLLGHTILVNGTAGPYQEVRTDRVRLRLLNASNARIYNFGFDDSRRFSLVASDGGLLERPVALTRLQLSPGERAEIVVEMSPGTTAVLKSYPPDLDSAVPPATVGGGDTFEVLQLRAAASLAGSHDVPERLADPAPAAGDRVARTLTLTLEGRQINGRTMDMSRIDQVVEVGTSEIWEVRNQNPFPHNFHVHDQQFRVLSIDGRQPPPELAGRKDTVYLSPHHTYRLLLTFRDYTDPQTPYMYHCHLLLHEDEGMMGQFVVVEPGGRAEHPSPHAGAHEHRGRG
jgi:FtsP/CotA-like multicopper oxidase with cupredoxin domain